MPIHNAERLAELLNYAEEHRVFLTCELKGDRWYVETTRNGLRKQNISHVLEHALEQALMTKQGKVIRKNYHRMSKEIIVNLSDYNYVF